VRQHVNEARFQRARRRQRRILLDKVVNGEWRFLIEILRQQAVLQVRV